MPIRDEAINVFMGLPGDGARLELTYNHGVDSYEIGTGYNHIAVTVEDLDGTLEPGWPSRASSPRSRPTRCARAAPGSASCATRTGTGSSSSRPADAPLVDPPAPNHEAAREGRCRRGLRHQRDRVAPAGGEHQSLPPPQRRSTCPIGSVVSHAIRGMNARSTAGAPRATTASAPPMRATATPRSRSSSAVRWAVRAWRSSAGTRSVAADTARAASATAATAAGTERRPERSRWPSAVPVSRHATTSPAAGSARCPRSRTGS